MVRIVLQADTVVGDLSVTWIKKTELLCKREPQADSVIGVRRRIGST